MSTYTFDEVTFYKLIYEYETWESIIKRKNASKDPNLVKLRVQRITDAYNNIILYVKELFKTENYKLRKKVRTKIINIRDRTIECLTILDAKADIPTDLTQIIPENDNPPNQDEETNNKMNKLDYYNACSRSIKDKFMGDPMGLRAFLRSIKFLQSLDTANDHEKTLIDFIMQRVEGKAAECLPEEPKTVAEIVSLLKEHIKEVNSKIVEGRLMALRADRNNFTDYAKKTEELADQLKRSLIMENIPIENANRMAIDRTIELCQANTTSYLVKSALESTPFNEPKDVVAKFIITSRKEKPETQILTYHTNNQNNQRGMYRRNFRGNAFRSNFRGNYHQNQNPQNNWTNTNNRQNPRNFYNNNQRYQRGFRGRGRGYKRNYNNRNNRIFYTENTEAPPPGAIRMADSDNTTSSQ